MENTFSDLSEQFIESVVERLASKITGWRVTDKDAKSFDPKWTPEQIEWFNLGVDSVRDLLLSMKDGNL